MSSIDDGRFERILRASGLDPETATDEEIDRAMLIYIRAAERLGRHYL